MLKLNIQVTLGVLTLSLFIFRHCEKMMFSSTNVIVMLGIFLFFGQSNAKFDDGEETEGNIPEKIPHESNHHRKYGM